MATLVSIRHSIDTEDEFYAEENDFIDENRPKFENLVSKFYKELVNSKFRKELEKHGESKYLLLQNCNYKLFQRR